MQKPKSEKNFKRFASTTGVQSSRPQWVKATNVENRSSIDSVECGEFLDGLTDARQGARAPTTNTSSLQFRVQSKKPNPAPTPLVDHGDQPTPGVVVVGVLLHVLRQVDDLLRQDRHLDAGRPRILFVYAPLQLSSLPRQFVEVSLQ